MSVRGHTEWMHEAPARADVDRDAPAPVRRRFPASWRMWRLGTQWGLFLVCAAAIAFSTTTDLVHSDVKDVLYLGLVGAAATVGAGSLIVARPGGRVGLGWSAIVFGLFFQFVGECIWTWYARTGRDPFPSIADAAYLVASLSMLTGAILIFRSRQSGIDRSNLFDAAIVAVAMLTALWVVLIGPTLADLTTMDRQTFVVLAYPLIDVALTVTIARVVLDNSRPPGAIKLLLLGLVLLTASDVAYYVQELNGTYSEWGWIAAGFQVAIACIGAALLHPSMPNVAASPEVFGPLGRRRLSLLAGAALIPPVLLLIEVLSNDPSDEVLLAVITITMFVLVIGRGATLVGAVENLSAQRSRMRFASVVRQNPDAVVMADREHRLTNASRAFERLWGRSLAEGQAASIDDLVVDADRDRIHRWLHHVIVLGSDESSKIVVRIERCGAPDENPPIDVEITGIHQVDADVDAVILIVRDVSEQLALESKLRHQAFHDELTGLANRALFVETLGERLTQMSDDGGRAAVFLADLDDFKMINDGLGHSVGDELLIEVGERLKSVAVERLEDHWTVARLGGDEFALLVPDIAADSEVEALAEQLAAVLDEPFGLGGVLTAVSASIGAFVVDEQTDVSTVLTNADLAMYRAKQQGKRRVSVFTPDLAEAAHLALELRQGLDGAVDRNEISLVYQPIFRATGRPDTAPAVIVEALARWTTPDGVSVPPDEFIASAETSGAIHEIGQWVLRTASRFAALDLPDEVSVSINVSPLQLRDQSFEHQVIEALHNTRLDPGRLIIEVTESVAADVHAVPVLHRLRQRGVRVAIDDFGTGFSSLSYLQEFPVDLLKIDRSFVQRVCDDPFMVSAVVDLARGVGALTIAEGVETLEQYETLRSVGCDLMQGYLLESPQSSDELLRRFSLDTEPVLNR